MRRLPAVAGLAALGVSAGASLWLAAGVAGTHRWLELPTRADPRWIDGPLHGLGVHLTPTGLGAGLVVLLLAYGVALLCARSIDLRWALLAVGLADLAFALAPSVLSTDVFGYIAYGRELVPHGLNPYVVPPRALAGDPVLQYVYWKGEPSPYGPLFTALSAALGPAGVAVQFWVHKAVAAGAALVLAGLAAQAALARGQNRARVAIFVGLNPVVLFYAVGGAHNDLLATALLVAGVRLALGGRDRAAGAVAALAAGIKVTLGLGLPFVVLLARRRNRSAQGAALGILALAVLALPPFGTHIFDQLQRIAGEARFDTRFSGPDRLARLLGTHITPAVRAAATALPAVVAVIAFVRALRGADPVTAAGWSFVAVLLAIASLAPWYIVWLLPFAALGRSRALSAVALLASAYLIAVHLPQLGGEPWLSAP